MTAQGGDATVTNISVSPSVWQLFVSRFTEGGQCLFFIYFLFFYVWVVREFSRLDLDHSDVTESASAAPHVCFMHCFHSWTLEYCAREGLPTNDAAVRPSTSSISLGGLILSSNGGTLAE